MKARAFPTIFPTVGKSDAHEKTSILLGAPGGSRIPNLLIRSHSIARSPRIAPQRLSYVREVKNSTVGVTDQRHKVASSHDFPHGFLGVIRHCSWQINRAVGQGIASAGTAQEWLA